MADITAHRIDHHELAQQLLRAKRTKHPIPALTTDHPTMTADDAYRIQNEVVAGHLALGARIVGYKVGLTSLAMQEMLGVDQPDYGPILDSMKLEDGATLSLGELIEPRVEAEIAFILGDELRGPGLTRSHVEEAIAGVFPSLEIIDSRIQNWNIGLADTIADHASCSHVVFSEHRVPLAEIHPREIRVALSSNGEDLASGRGDAVMGDPVEAVLWAGNTLGELGVTLEPGFVVMPGALHTALVPQPGRTYTARFDRLGSVSVRFVE